MTDRLDGLRVACLTANEGVEQVELIEPNAARCGRSWVAPKQGVIQGFHHFDKADTCPVDQTLGMCRSATSRTSIRPWLTPTALERGASVEGEGKILTTSVGSRGRRGHREQRRLLHRV